MLDLSSINIYTAGGSSSDMTIPGVRTADAQQMKEYILESAHIKTNHDEEE
jgi:membrane protein YdbS with pleckstrin-like domain